MVWFILVGDRSDLFSALDVYRVQDDKYILLICVNKLALDNTANVITPKNYKFLAFEG